MVATTEVDFFQHSTTSRVVVREGPVVGLDYRLKTLLVSTATSCFLLRGERRVQVGSQRRGGRYGGVLLQTGVGEQGLRVVVVRPDNRLCLAEVTSGEVESTVVLGEAMASSHAQMTLINPANLVSEEATTSSVLRVAVLNEPQQLVLLWNKAVLHLVSLKTRTVLASCSSLRSILDLDVTETGEIYVLESGRSVVRLAPGEDR